MQKISDAHWEWIKPHFPEENIPDGRPGRKPVPTRQVLDAVLWILNTGAQWKMLPQSYPNYKTVHRRFQAWVTAPAITDGILTPAGDGKPFPLAVTGAGGVQHNRVVAVRKQLHARWRINPR